MLPTIEWKDDAVVMIDQRKLPGAEVYVKCQTGAQVAKAIKTMVIRGAPAIGVAAAMGLALGVKQSKATGTQKLATEFYRLCEMMAATRPTAVNLFWAIDRMKRVFAAAATAGASVDQIKSRLEQEAMDPQTVARAGYDGLMKSKIVVLPGLRNKLIPIATRFIPRPILATMAHRAARPSEKA